MEQRNMGEEGDKSREVRETSTSVFWRIFLVDELPKHSQKVHNGTKTKNSVLSLIQDSVGCLQITEPSKVSKNDLCDLRIPTTLSSEVFYPRGIITKNLKAAGKRCLVLWMDDTLERYSFPSALCVFIQAMYHGHTGKSSSSTYDWYPAKVFLHPQNLWQRSLGTPNMFDYYFNMLSKGKISMKKHLGMPQSDFSLLP